MPAVPFSRLQAEMLALYSPPFRKKSTWFKLRTVLREFGELPSVKRSSDLTPMAIHEWVKAHSDRARSTNRSYLLPVRATCNYAKKMGYLRMSPWDFRKDWLGEIQEEPLTTRHQSIAAIASFLSVLDEDALSGIWELERLQALGYVYAYTGMRKMEALGLRLIDLDLPARIIFIRSYPQRPLKTQKSAAPVGIPEELAVVLERWRRRAVSGPWGAQCVPTYLFPRKDGLSYWREGRPGTKPLDMIRSAGRKAGIERLTIQSFRHSFATHARVWGLGQLELKGQLRHTSLRTQETYIGDDLAGIQTTARRISYRLSASAN